jgi:DNA-binding Lrp family transcriptional regulator
MERTAALLGGSPHHKGAGVLLSPKHEPIHWPSNPGATGYQAILEQTSTMRVRLDATDWRILKELQADARITNVALAQRVGITPPPCLRRVRALEEAGLITGYHAQLDERALGFELTAFAMVGLRSQSEAELREFENRLLSWPLVREAYMMSGESDYILKCIAPDLTTFQDFVINELTAAPNVGSVKTALAIRRAKLEPGVPLSVLGH